MSITTRSGLESVNTRIWTGSDISTTKRVRSSCSPMRVLMMMGSAPDGGWAGAPGLGAGTEELSCLRIWEIRSSASWDGSDAAQAAPINATAAPTPKTMANRRFIRGAPKRV